VDCDKIFSPVPAFEGSLLYFLAVPPPELWGPDRPGGCGKIQPGTFPLATDPNPDPSICISGSGVAQDVEEEKRNEKVDPGESRGNPELV